MIIINCKQGEPEWFQEKLGKPSSSNFDKIITSTGKPSTQRKDYLYRLAAEIISGQPADTYQNQAMQDGIDREAESRSYFSLITGFDVTEVGLVYKDNEKSALCSPDGLIESKISATISGKPVFNTGLELKNPLAKTQIGYLLDNKLPTKYVCQVQGSMWITGFKYWWFMSYVPGLPVLLIKVERDNEFISKLEKAVNGFIIELNETVEKLRGL